MSERVEMQRWGNGGGDRGGQFVLCILWFIFYKPRYTFY